jgi:hypothetical protein
MIFVVCLIVAIVAIVFFTADAKCAPRPFPNHREAKQFLLRGVGADGRAAYFAVEPDDLWGRKVIDVFEPGTARMVDFSENFERVWSVVKNWDPKRPSDSGYRGATGDDVRAILSALGLK